jgi:hypothetical protein
MRLSGIKLFEFVAVSAVFIFLAVTSGDLRAQSLSDFDWEGFEGGGGAPKVQSHTDPFASGAVAADDLSVEDLQLTGIVFKENGKAFALVSGYLVRPGDRIAGFRVDRIDKETVRLKRLDEVYILALGGGI